MFIFLVAVFLFSRFRFIFTLQQMTLNSKWVLSIMLYPIGLYDINIMCYTSHHPQVSKHNCHTIYMHKCLPLISPAHLHWFIDIATNELFIFEINLNWKWIIKNLMFGWFLPFPFLGVCWLMPTNHKNKFSKLICEMNGTENEGIFFKFYK